MKLAINQILDAYLALSDEEKTQFLKELGKVSPGEAAIILCGALPPLEREVFSDWVGAQLEDLVFPHLVQAARELAKETIDVPDEKFDRVLGAQLNSSTIEHSARVREIEAMKLKAKRDRKTSPKTIKRNVEICDLRKENRKLWSQGRLAKKYKITARAIRKILDDEQKWRAMATELGTN